MKNLILSFYKSGLFGLLLVLAFFFLAYALLFNSPSCGNPPDLSCTEYTSEYVETVIP